MIECIQKVIASIPAITDYKIEGTTSTTYELFYVLKELETSRATDSTKYNVTIYTTVEGQRGSTTVTVGSYYEEDEIKELLEEAVENANQALNPYYELVEAKEFNNESEEKVEFASLASTITDAVFAADHYEEGWINSTEIFLTHQYRELVTSKGIHYAYNHFEIMVEVIPTWQAKDEEVELLEVYRSSNVNAADITEDIEEALENVKNRSIATLIQNKDVPIILQKQEVAQLFLNLINEANYMHAYKHTNLFNVGDSIQEGATGDLITITGMPGVTNSITAAPIDEDGIILKPEVFIQDGKILKLWGSNQLGQYLQLEPTGNYHNLKVELGTTSLKDMCNEPVLLCVNMSGLQIERFSNYIGGEVRLGYYIDGDTMIPVTSLSISGNLKEAKKEMTLSSESFLHSRGYEGPKYVKMKGFKIN